MSLHRFIGLIRGSMDGELPAGWQADFFGALAILSRAYPSLDALQTEVIDQPLVMTERDALMRLSRKVSPVAFRPDMVAGDDAGYAAICKLIVNTYAGLEEPFWHQNERIVACTVEMPQPQSSAPADFLRSKVRQKARAAENAARLDDAVETLQAVVAEHGGKTIAAASGEGRRTLSMLLRQQAENAAFDALLRAFADSAVTVKVSDRQPITQFAPPVMAPDTADA